MPRLFPYSEPYNAPVSPEPALLCLCRHHRHPPEQPETSLQTPAPQKKPGHMLDMLSSSSKVLAAPALSRLPVDAGCQLRLPCLSVPRCLPGGWQWHGNSPSRLFLLHFPVPNTFGQTFGSCRAPGLTHVGATPCYGSDFLVVPPACSKGDEAGAVTRCRTLNLLLQHANFITFGRN